MLLVDTGYGSDSERTLALLARHGIEPRGLRVFNTHWHSDHVGGNHVLQTRFDARIAAHEKEGRLVNERVPDACGSVWLDQPVESYRVDELLPSGGVIRVGERELLVIPTPGHSLGQASLLDIQTRVLIGGDVLLPNDVPWINPFLDGGDAGERAFRSVESLRRHRSPAVMPGHGPAIDDPARAIERTLERYRSLFADPPRLAWHGARRVFGYALMIRGGIPRGQLDAYLHRRRWVRDFARLAAMTADAFARELVAGMLRNGAAAWSPAQRLVSTVPHHEPPPGWLKGPGFPADWP